MRFPKAIAKSKGFSRIFAFGLIIFSGAGLINLCTVCAETTDELQGPPVVQSHIIGIDPGHQGPNVDMSDLEPLGPGSTEMKAKASTGTQGTFSGLPEYQLNLDVSLKLQQILENRGYQTVLTRTDNDTAISNKERAEYVAANPVMVLDEVDKLAKDYGGDPASALLEVLDPEQNGSFTDHYMNVPYDLSNVLFVCTANSTDTIPEPLLNRMEVIQFPGYTAVEKFQIARRHLLPKAMKSMGIKAQNLKVTDEAIRRIIEEYTAEAGVRGLKKQMDVLCRYAAVKLVKGEQKSITVSEKRVAEFLGHGIHHEKILENPVPGVVTGLAWTSAGGEILFIETSFTKGDGKVIITGQLGDVMKESAQIAITLVKSLYPEFADKFKENDLHIHVPAGAVPKDGPSAGITLVTALSSLVTGKPAPAEIAMTGEVSLRGGVMPIGGLPEKLMAAQRAGVKHVFIPYENMDDLDDVADEVKEKLEITPVKTVQEVLDYCLQPAR